MSVAGVVIKFGFIYIATIIIVSLIITAIGMKDSTIVGILAIVLILRYVVSQYMKEHGAELPSEIYWKIFFGVFMIVMVYNMLVLIILAPDLSLNASAMMISILIGTVLNIVAVFAGLFQAKKMMLKNKK